ncbi:MAG: hypothetical protein V4547_18890 [Bacteroidota bacterium]
MKKLFLLMSLSLFVLTSFAQVSMTGNGDTVTDTGTDFVVKQVEGTYKNVSIQAVFSKVSGTIAGTAILYGSIDGTNYVSLSGAVGDTLLMTDVTTNTKVWVLNNSNYMYYKVVFLGVGTMSGRIYGYVFTADPLGKHATTNMLSNYSKVSDTIVNSGSGYIDKRVVGGYNTLSIQTVVTRLSGTAGGTVTVQGSCDGTNFVTVNTSYITAQTQSISNAVTNTKVFVITGSPYAYYRLSYTGTGTMSCTLKGYLLPNR